MGASSAAIVVNATMCVLGIIVFSLFGGVERWEVMGLFWFVMVGLLGPFGARFLQYKAIPRIGLARKHILLQSMPAWSAAIAIVFLGEVLALRVALGTAAIMAGSMFLVKEEHPGGGGRYPSSIIFFPLLRRFSLG